MYTRCCLSWEFACPAVTHPCGRYDCAHRLWFRRTDILYLGRKVQDMYIFLKWISVSNSAVLRALQSRTEGHVFTVRYWHSIFFREYKVFYLCFIVCWSPEFEKSFPADFSWDIGGLPMRFELYIKRYPRHRSSRFNCVRVSSDQDWEVSTKGLIAPTSCVSLRQTPGTIQNKLTALILSNPALTPGNKTVCDL